MSDLISRAELFNRLATINADPEANDLKAEIYAVIQGMPTVGAKWIPCGERLPEENGKSYLTYQCGDDIRYGWCQVLRYDDGWNCFKGDKENEIKCVVAWMPLPEPWEGTDDDAD